MPYHCASSVGVAAHDGGDLAQDGHDALGAAGEGGLQVGEEPRAAEAAAADDDAVATGFAHHAQRVVGFPDVAVAEHGNVEGLLERGDGLPVGLAGVALGGGAGVQGDPLDARPPGR